MTSGVATSNQIVYLNSPIKEINYTLTGATDAVITGLPLGVQKLFSGDKYTITGIPRQPGTFHYVLSNHGICSVDTVFGCIDVKNLRIFPNPTSGNLSILNINGFSLGIFDISGHQIYFKIFPSEQRVIEKDFSDVLKQDGVYMFVVKENDTGEILSLKKLSIYIKYINNLQCVGCKTLISYPKQKN